MGSNYCITLMFFMYVQYKLFKAIKTFQKVGMKNHQPVLRIHKD